MKGILSFFLLTLLITFSSQQTQQTCPYEKYKTNVTGQVLVNKTLDWHQPQSLKILYGIEEESGSAKLKAYRTQQLFDTYNILNNLDVEQFQMIVNKSDTIAYVSPSGDCIVVDHGKTLIAYSTTQNDFQKIQEINQTTYSDIRASEQCNIVELELVDSNSETSIFVNGSRLVSANVPDSGTVFDSTFSYGVNGQGKAFKYMTNGQFEVQNIQGVLSEVIQVKMRYDQSAVLVLSKDKDETGKYSLQVFDTSNWASLFSQTWESSNGIPKLFTQVQLKSAMLRDDQKMLVFLRIRQVNGNPSVTKVELDGEETAENYIAKAENIAMGQDFIVTYDNALADQTNQGINYFKVQSVDTLVYLGGYSFNFTAEKEKLAKGKTQDFALYVIVAPIVTDECELTDQDLKIVEHDDILKTNDTNLQNETLLCPGACISCNSNAFCIKCRPGYVSNNGACFQCIGGCKTCNKNQRDVCFSCFADQVFDSTTKTCIQSRDCPENCLNCDEDKNCLTCTEYYYLTDARTCDLCLNDGCKYCNGANSNQYQCEEDQCGQTFVYYNKTCHECVTGCLSCLTYDLSSCTECMPGFYPLIDENQNPKAKSCLPCMDNCDICQDASTCTTCSPTHKTNQDKKCILKCDTICLTCLENQPSVCDSCRYGYELDGTTCVVDLQCNTTATCKSCPSMHALKNDLCIACQTTSDSNCAGCNSNNITKCLFCKSSYFLNDNNICQSCSQKCTSCKDSTLCYTCKSGSFLLKDKNDPLKQGYCKECESPCATCFNAPDVCKSCKDGFTLYGRKCLSNNLVQFSVQFLTSVGQYIKISEQVFNKIRTNIKAQTNNQMFEFGKKDYIVYSIQKGSTIVKGNVSTDSQNQPAVVEGLEIALEPGTYINGVQIQAATVEGKVVQPIDQNQTPGGATEPVNSNLVWILAVIIPLVILVIAAIIIALIRYKRKQQEREKVTNTSQSLSSGATISINNQSARDL